ncbi:hypothetical protein ABVK25_004321 [Lepraria finkii]|uniref:Uncharacterized protein n=1 Tax=Lepraria finkii TaxID=1340010 RepID=A0ABR4BCE0_9LECA
MLASHSTTQKPFVSTTSRNSATDSPTPPQDNPTERLLQTIEDMNNKYLNSDSTPDPTYIKPPDKTFTAAGTLLEKLVTAKEGAAFDELKLRAAAYEENCPDPCSAVGQEEQEAGVAQLRVFKYERGT